MSTPIEEALRDGIPEYFRVMRAVATIILTAFAEDEAPPKKQRRKAKKRPPDKTKRPVKKRKVKR